jgi:NifU-like protein involved in Fe-S cluster formation
MGFKVMNTDLYNQQILDLCADVPRLGRLPDAHGSSTRYSKLCGSSITIDVKLEGGRISDFAMELEADALGKAAASFLARHVVGKNLNELKALCGTMHAMLESNGAPPEGEWADLKMFEGVRDYPARHASLLLPFEALVAAVEKALENSVVMAGLDPAIHVFDSELVDARAKPGHDDE